jgi:hypothetical protein
VRPPKWSHEFTPDELAERIYEAAKLPAAAGGDFGASVGEVAQRDYWQDLAKMYIVELDLSELRGLVVWLASVERGREQIGPVDDIDVADAIAYLELQRQVKR